MSGAQMTLLKVVYFIFLSLFFFLFSFFFFFSMSGAQMFGSFYFNITAVFGTFI